MGVWGRGGSREKASGHTRSVSVRCARRQADVVVEGIEKLQYQAASTAFVLNNGKFKQEGRFEMAYGGLALFYGGLEALIGPPTMVDGSLIKSMEQVAT